MRSVLYTVELGIAVQNCFITEEERLERDERREEKETMKAYEDIILKSPTAFPMSPGAVPMTPSAMPMTPGTATYPRAPMPVATPRSLAFNRLDSSSTNDLPLREHFSPDPQAVKQEVEATGAGSGQQQPSQIYFPPPPKKGKK
jgi:hypothetical protein